LRRTKIILEPFPRDPRKKITKAILDFIDIRTFQEANLTNCQLAAQIQTKFEVGLDPSTEAITRK
jgi:hypothetical protein